MIDSNEMLRYIYEASDMGCYGIQSILDETEQGPFRDALKEQMTEYARLREESGGRLRQRGITPEGVGTVAKLSSRMMSGLKTMTDHSPSHIAEMMIEGNTMGMTKSIQHLHDYQESDDVRDLADQLLKTEENNIRQMKQFL